MENAAFYGSGAGVSVRDTNVHPTELVTSVNSIFPISQNSWEGDGNPMHRMILQK